MTEDTEHNLSIDECYRLLKESLSEVSKNIIDKLETYQRNLTSKLETANNKISELEKVNKQLTKKIDRTEREIRKNNIIIFGVEEQEGENLYNKVCTLLKTKVSTDITKQEISSCYRFGRKNNSKHRPITVKFVALHKKQEVFSKCGQLKGSTISISNDLSIKEREIQKVLKKHLKEAKDQGLQASIKRNVLLIEGNSYNVEQLQAIEKDREDSEDTHQHKKKKPKPPSSHEGAAVLPAPALPEVPAQIATVSQKQPRTRYGSKKQ